MLPPARKLDVMVNGSAMELGEGTTVSDLLRLLELDNVLVAVELNRDILPKARYKDQLLSSGDRIEIVHFVGGG